MEMEMKTELSPIAFHDTSNDETNFECPIARYVPTFSSFSFSQTDRLSR